MLPDQLRALLRKAASPNDAAVLQRFFKTGPGEYGEGDLFLGVRVPAIRKLTPLADDLTEAQITSLLRAAHHEERLLALLILVRQFERGNEAKQKSIVALYLQEKQHINNWDLVDLSAPNILGKWFLHRPRKPLLSMAGSANVWERRMAVLATLSFIRAGEDADTLSLCKSLLADRHDLIHKACGWMLREIGKRRIEALTGFLDQHAGEMPRTMLRYAIERLPESRRIQYLGAKKSRAGKTDGNMRN